MSGVCTPCERCPLHYAGIKQWKGGDTRNSRSIQEEHSTLRSKKSLSTNNHFIVVIWFLQEGPVSPALALAYSPSGILAAAHENGIIYLWGGNIYINILFTTGSITVCIINSMFEYVCNRTSTILILILFLTFCNSSQGLIRMCSQLPHITVIAHSLCCLYILL